MNYFSSVILLLAFASLLLDWTTKKTEVPSILACGSVATQRPSSVNFVGPQRARHNIKLHSGFFI
jgi:hypothetical protein